MEKLAMCQQLLRLTLISAAKRFAGLSIELRVDDESAPNRARASAGSACETLRYHARASGLPKRRGTVGCNVLPSRVAAGRAN